MIRLINQLARLIPPCRLRLDTPAGHQPPLSSGDLAPNPETALALQIPLPLSINRTSASPNRTSQRAHRGGRSAGGGQSTMAPDFPKGTSGSGPFRFRTFER